MQRIDILEMHEIWASKVSSIMICIFSLCACPVLLMIQNVPMFWRIILSICCIIAAGLQFLLSRNKKTSVFTKYYMPIFLNTFGFLMTITMGKGNRSVPFFFFSILAFSLIYLNPKVILVAAAGTIVAHGIMICFFPEQIFALHEPAMYIYVGFIYFLYFPAMYTVAAKALSLLSTLKTREEEQTRLNLDLSKMQEQIAVASAQLRTTCVALSKQAGEVVSASQETASGMEEMARMVDVETNEVTKVSQNVVEINSIAEQIKRRSQELSVDFAKTKNLSQQGAELMLSSIKGMKKAGGQIGEVAEAARRLKESSLKIRDILTIMNEIAEKTTLLSLNANIEAARAGDAGRGFAVVASSISKLAEQSAQETEEIKEIISGTMQDMDQVMESIESILSIVAKSAEDSSVVADSIENIMNNIEKNSTQINEIHQVLDNLISMNNAIMDATNSLAGIAEETSAGTEEISATTQQQATTIEQIVQQIRNLEEMASNLDAMASGNSG